MNLKNTTVIIGYSYSYVNLIQRSTRLCPKTSSFLHETYGFHWILQNSTHIDFVAMLQILTCVMRVKVKIYFFCFYNVKLRMSSQKFKFNDDRTGIIIIGNNIKTLPQTTININGHKMSNSKKEKKSRFSNRPYISVFIINIMSISFVTICIFSSGKSAAFKFLKRDSKLEPCKIPSSIQTLLLQYFIGNLLFY